MPRAFEDCRPGGTIENSPTFQRWVLRSCWTSHEGTADSILSQPSLRDLRFLGRIPSVKTLGYYRTSLRDEGKAYSNTGETGDPGSLNYHFDLWLKL